MQFFCFWFFKKASAEECKMKKLLKDLTHLDIPTSTVYQKDFETKPEGKQDSMIWELLKPCPGLFPRGPKGNLFL